MLPFTSKFYFFSGRGSRFRLLFALLVARFLNTFFALTDLFLSVPISFISISTIRIFDIILFVLCLALCLLSLDISLLLLSSLFPKFLLGSMRGFEGSDLRF